MCYCDPTETSSLFQIVIGKIVRSPDALNENTRASKKSENIKYVRVEITK